MGEHHDGGVFVFDDFEGVEGAGHEFESWGSVALVEHGEEIGVVDSGVEEFSGEAHDSAVDIGVLEPSGVGGESDIEGGGDVYGEFAWGVEAQDMAADFGGGLDDGGGVGVEESTGTDLGIALEVVVDDGGAVESGFEEGFEGGELGP